MVVPASALTIPPPASTAKLPAVCRLGAWAKAFDANAKKNNKQMTGFLIYSSKSFRRAFLGTEILQAASLRSQIGIVCSFLHNFATNSAV